MSAEIITTQIGEAAYERYLGPILDSPPAEIWADAEIDMRRSEQQDPGKIWWLAIDADALLAFCAAWPEDGKIQCGHNYELGHRDRAARHWPEVFAARQAWLVGLGRPAVTYVFEQPIALHLAHGWERTGLHDDSEHGHHWYELTWTPR